MAAVVFGVFSGTKGAHLELQGQVLKARTGALDDKTTAAILDFRIANPSKVLFMVREVKVTLEKANGETVEGRIVSKPDLRRLLEYNKFLGSQYNEILSIKDRVPAHGQIDRMVAATFEVPQAEFDQGKSLRLYIQDMDGAEFETTYKFR